MRKKVSGGCSYSAAVLKVFLFVALLGSFGTSKAQTDFTEISVNDWGSGFQATFEYAVKAEEAGPAPPWRIEISNTGSTTLNSAWMGGYGGGIDFLSEADNLSVITNENVGYKPSLSAGSVIQFTFQGQGGGYNAADFSFAFVTDTDEPEEPPQDSDTIGNYATSFVSVNDWYNPAWGGGFNATFECEAISTTTSGFTLEFNYSGSGEPSDAWAQSYNGAIEKGFIGSNDGYAVRSASSGYVPTITAGSTFRVVIAVQNAGYNAADFNVSCNGETAGQIGLNAEPVANAGQDQSVPVGTQVTLDGGQSTDADGDTLTFDWSLIEVPPGSTASIENPLGLMTTFEVDKFGDYRVQLIVDDGQSSSLPDETVISTFNSAPTADAGQDQQASVSDLVLLDSSGSTDVDGDTLTYSWIIISRPDGSAAALNDSTSMQPGFTPDIPGEYIIELVVSDGIDTSDADTSSVNVDTGNTKPVAHAGEDQSTVLGSTVVLDGSQSTDADGDSLSYEWSVLSQPELSNATPLPADGLTSTLLVEQDGDYLVQLIVDDGQVTSDPDTLSISTINSRPQAIIAAIADSTTDLPVVLDGTASEDPDGDELEYDWSIISSPDGSTASVDDPEAELTSMVADVEGVYVVQLIVSDGNMPSDPVTQSINISSVESITVEYTEPANGAVFADSAELDLVIQLNQAVTGVFGDEPFVSDESNQVVLPIVLAEGTNTVSIQFNNTLGDISQETFTFYLDTIAPQIPDQSSIAVTAVDNQITVSGEAGSVEPDSIVTLTNLGTDTSVTVIAEADGSFEASIEGDSEDSLGVTTSDAALNSSDTLIVTAPVDIPDTSSVLTGLVSDITETPIAGALISAVNLASGQVEIQTVGEPDGTYQLLLEASTDYVLQITSDDYAEQIKSLETLAAGESRVFDATLIARAQPDTFAEDVGGEITGDAGSSVSVLGNSFEQAQGTGAIEVTITPLDTSDAAVVEALPGELSVISDQGAGVELEFFGAVEIEFTDASGNALDLVPGIDAEISIPIYVNDAGTQALTEGASVSIWTLNEQTGIWMEDGVGSVVVNTQSPTGLAVIAEVSHFSYYAVGAISDVPVASIDSGQLQNLILMAATLDSDGDGVADITDEFPLDETESVDSDEDGVGDNADAFPLDDTETEDSDEDGVGDNADAFPLDETESVDSDEDGVGDNADAFPLDETESVDSDEDGVGDNAERIPVG